MIDLPAAILANKLPIGPGGSRNMLGLLIGVIVVCLVLYLVSSARVPSMPPDPCELFFSS
jgi:hypothetical protein